MTWDFRVLNAAVECLGGSLFNERGTMHRVLDVSIKHAMDVWMGKYGPLNLVQTTYAASVLEGCIRSAVADPGDGHPMPLIKYRIGQAVNHEVTHAGFLSRRVGFIDYEARIAYLEAAVAA